MCDDPPGALNPPLGAHVPLTTPLQEQPASAPAFTRAERGTSGGGTDKAAQTIEECDDAKEMYEQHCVERGSHAKRVFGSGGAGSILAWSTDKPAI